MNSDEIKEIIWSKTWQGFYSKRDIIEHINDNFFDDEKIESKVLNQAVNQIWDIKREEEKNWPSFKETDFYKLALAFDNLHLSGIIALHNAGYTQSDCFDTAMEVYETVNQSEIKGYCYYHEQDIERLIPEFNSDVKSPEKSPLHIGYGTFNDSNSSADVAQLIVHELNKYGLNISWNNDINQRIQIHNITWQKSYDSNNWSHLRSVHTLNEHIPYLRKIDSKKWWEFWK